MAEEILDGMFKAAAEAPAESAPEPTPEPTPPAEPVSPEPAAEPEAEPQPEPASEAPAPKRPEPGYVPIAAVMDERDKRKALEAQLAQYRAQEQRPQAPDPFDDSEGYARHINQTIQDAIIADRVERDWENVVEKHGKEEAEAAKVWASEKAQSDPAFGQQLDVAFQTKVRPIEWVVQQHKRDALLSDIGDPSKLDDWFAREAAKRGFTQSAPVGAAPIPVVAPVQPAPKPVAPPRSIAGDASPNGTAPVDNNAFWSFLDRK